MSRKWFLIAAVGVFGLVALASFYVFSRFTVDDAFITWRYGRNLVEAGVWGYNPTTFDLTQAYTNPLLAVMSIIPAALGIDVVLFFKLFALATVLAPLWFFRRMVAEPWLLAALYLAFIAMPVTMVHAFAGLETFVFVLLMGGLLVALSRQYWLGANWLAAALLFVRPEAWLLVGLVPAYFLFHALDVARWRRFYLPSSYDAVKLRQAVLSAVWLGGVFAVYAAFHYVYFGYVLPNTFYIKSGKAHALNLPLLRDLLLFVSPALILLVRKQWSLFAFIALFFLPVVVNYAVSDLQMDYIQRFGYHVFGPIFLLLAYLAAREVRLMTLTMGAASAALLAFAYHTTYIPSLVGIANYYPRILDAHAALGKEINAVHAKYGIKSFALSDAGMAAYNANIIAFDNTGLGSARVAHEGPTMEVIAEYHPDIVVLRADDAGVVLSSESKKNLYQWAMDAGYKPLCDIYWKPEYRLRMFAPKTMVEFLPICAASKESNTVADAEYFSKQWRVAPWRYWRE